jgi:hypothetical protein
MSDILAASPKPDIISSIAKKSVKLREEVKDSLVDDGLAILKPPV